MLMPRLIPCLDVADGRVVKGIRFQGLRDAGDPVERAAAYAEQDADELVILDVAATPHARDTQTEVVRAVRLEATTQVTATLYRKNGVQVHTAQMTMHSLDDFQTVATRMARALYHRLPVDATRTVA